MPVRTLALCASLTIVGWTLPAQAQEQMLDEERASIERTIADSLRAEKQAFGAGDCEAALGFLAEDSHFVVGGRTMPKAAMQALCARIATKGAPFEREVEQDEVYVLSSDAAYTVTTYAVGHPSQGTQTTPSTQVVTKVWALRDGRWRIVHFHESMTRPPSK